MANSKENTADKAPAAAEESKALKVSDKVRSVTTLVGVKKVSDVVTAEMFSEEAFKTLKEKGVIA